MKEHASGLAFSVKRPRATPSVFLLQKPGWVFSQAQHPMIKTYNQRFYQLNYAIRYTVRNYNIPFLSRSIQYIQPVSNIVQPGSWNSLSV